MSKKNKDKICQLIQNMIITGNYYDKINSVDIQKIKDHTEQCKTCRQYQGFIHNTFNLMKVQEFRDPDIEKNIQRNLTGYLKKKQKIYFHNNFWNLIIQFFKYKIPIYQPVFAFIITFFIIYGMKNIQFKDENKDIIQKSIDSLKTSPLPVEYNYVIDNLDIIKAQRIGESISKDSSIVQLSHPIL